MTKTALYCTTAAAFEQDLKTPPKLALITRRLAKGKANAVHFTVSKISSVGITLLRGDKTVFLTSAQFSYGEHSFEVPIPTTPGSYTLKLDATDLAGNYAQVAYAVHVG